MSIQQSAAGLSLASGSTLLFDHIENGGEMWDSSGIRLFTKRIKFEAAFNQPPQVMISLGMIDADHSTNLRLQLRAEDINRNSFKAVAETWGDTRIGRLSISWLAIGKNGSEWDV